MMRSFLLSILLTALGFSSAYAQSPYGYPFTIENGSISYGSSNLTFAATPTPVYRIPNANGPLVVDSASRVGLPGGRSFDVAVRSVPSPANIAKAVTRFASKVVTPLVIGVAIYDLAKDLGFGVDNSSGTLAVTKDVVTCGGFCTGYKATLQGQPQTAEFSTFQAAAESARDRFNATHTPSNFYLVNVTQSGFSIYSDTAYTSVYGSYEVQTRSESNTATPSTLQELSDAIAAQSGWPSGSPITTVLPQAIASGETLPLPVPTVTGPASVPGPTTTQTTPAQNGNPASTKTTSTVYNITYEGNKVTTNNTTTSVVNNGSTTTTTTETSEEKPELSPSDSPNPDLPKLYERKYPDGLTGVWTTRKAQLTSSPLLSLLGNMTPTISGSGGCPQFSIPATIGPLVFGTGYLGPPCAVWDFCKIVILLTAAFLARAIIFGG